MRKTWKGWGRSSSVYWREDKRARVFGCQQCQSVDECQADVKLYSPNFNSNVLPIECWIVALARRRVAQGELSSDHSVIRYRKLDRQFGFAAA